MQTAALILEFVTPQGAYDRVRTLVEVLDREDIRQKMNELALTEIPSGAVIQGGTIEWLQMAEPV
ncbi:MAG TPA: hypothetical protein VLJ37_09610 [bacterium]|nr:hypothetical protein [bacterium]